MPDPTPRRPFEDVAFGEELPAIPVDVSMDRVQLFAQTTGMTFPRFTSHEGAREEGLPGAIVPGIMSQGILVAMVHRWAPGCRVRFIDTVFRAPVQVDSQPVCRGVVTSTDPETRSLEIDLTICNEAGETRVMGTATVEL